MERYAQASYSKPVDTALDVLVMEFNDKVRHAASASPEELAHTLQSLDSLLEFKEREVNRDHAEREGFETLRRNLGERYYLKAMNCPHHHRIFAAEPRSYRDLPLRFAEYGTNYRLEAEGELFGLMRVRGFNMNDAHIYCTEEQFAAEFNGVNDLYLKYFKIFG